MGSSVENAIVLLHMKHYLTVAGFSKDEFTFIGLNKGSNPFEAYTLVVVQCSFLTDMVKM